MFPEKRHTFSGDQRVRITGADVHPANAAFHQCLSAWRLLAVVAAWLQGDVDIRTGRVFDAVLQGVSFCVEIAVSGVPALTDDAVVFDDHRTHQGIGVGEPCATPCQLNGTFHIKRMLCHENTSKKCPVLQL